MGKVLEIRSKEDRNHSLNVLGEPLAICSCDPMTGWFRDGSCRTDDRDGGHHVICCVLTEDFLNFSKEKGNDLITPLPQYGFPGLKPGDHWCLCSQRWQEAFEEGKAPQVVLESTHFTALNVVKLEDLKQFAHTH